MTLTLSVYIEPYYEFMDVSATSNYAVGVITVLMHRTVRCPDRPKGPCAAVTANASYRNE